MELIEEALRASIRPFASTAAADLQKVAVLEETSRNSVSIWFNFHPSTSAPSRDDHEQSRSGAIEVRISGFVDHNVVDERSVTATDVRLAAGDSGSHVGYVCDELHSPCGAFLG